MMKNPKSKIRFYIVAIALLPFVLLLVTGAFMLIYHTGKPYESKAMGLDGHDWLMFHQIMSVIVIPMIILHLTIKTDWLKRLFCFQLKGKFKVSNLLIFVFFMLSFLSSFFSWLIIQDPDIANLLRGIHNKLGMVLLILFVIHLVHYSKMMVNMTKEIIVYM